MQDVPGTSIHRTDPEFPAWLRNKNRYKEEIPCGLSTQVRHAHGDGTCWDFTCILSWAGFHNESVKLTLSSYVRGSCVCVNQTQWRNVGLGPQAVHLAPQDFHCKVWRQVQPLRASIWDNCNTQRNCELEHVRTTWVKIHEVVHVRHGNRNAWQN